jgi:16S rRNA processing protein RimM
MNKKDCIETGLVVKTHGVNGELIIETSNPDFFEDIKEPVFLEIDGLQVPFFIERAQATSQLRVRVKFDCTHTETKAKKLVGRSVFVSAQLTEKKDDVAFIPSPDVIIGFEVIDSKYGSLGKVNEVAYQYTNPVMIVANPKTEILIPFHPDIISKVNFKKKQVLVKTPEGLVNLYLDEE